MRVLLATPYAEDKVHCINEFFTGVSRQSCKPDTLLFIVDDTRRRKKLQDYLTIAQQQHLPDVELLFEQTPEKSDHLEAIGEARNLALSVAVQKDVDFVWFLDADIHCASNALEKLVACNAGVSGALVASREMCPPLSRRPSRFNMYRRAIDKGHEVYNVVREFEPGAVVRVDCTGNDCLLISRELFTQQRYRWKTTPPRVGEDFAYCLDAVDKGFKVVVDTSVWVDHFSPLEVFSSRGCRLVRSWRYGVPGGHQEVRNA